MVSKSRKKAQKVQRAARDMQTPAPTEVSSDSESQQAEPSRAQELRQEYNRNNKGKDPERRARFVRSPTLPDDFAPNAGDHESDDSTDSEFEDASDQDAPIEHKIDPLSRWVKNVIRSETSKESERMVEDFFTSESPLYDACLQFFRRLNQHIRGANEDHDVNDIDTGTIPETGYNALCESWRQAAQKARDNGSPDEFWKAYNTTRRLLKTFNKRHYLPKSWNISQAWAEHFIGTPNPSIEEDTESTFDSDKNEPDQARQNSASGYSSTESDIHIDSGQLTGLDALEARTMKQQRQLHSAKVLYWWPKGTGSQIFVRYGSRSVPIYRIRAGSYESYNPSRVERVLTTKTRGTAKVTGTRNGLPEEFWKYKRNDVEDFIGIGWKVEDDEEQGLNPLNLLLPAKGIVYPQTRILVKWKDGLFTLEGRSFIRRITAGSALDGDRVIYQKAEELEYIYRRKHGLDEIDEDCDSEVGEPEHYSDQRRSKTRNHSESSESDDDGSDASIEPSHSRNRRYRSEPVRGLASSTQRRKPTHKRRGDSATEIKQLEHQIRRLRMLSPMPPQETRESQRRRHRGDRGRTA